MPIPRGGMSGEWESPYTTNALQWVQGQYNAGDAENESLYGQGLAGYDQRNADVRPLADYIGRNDITDLERQYLRMRANADMGRYTGPMAGSTTAQYIDPSRGESSWEDAARQLYRRVYSDRIAADYGLAKDKLDFMERHRRTGPSASAIGGLASQIDSSDLGHWRAWVSQPPPHITGPGPLGDGRGLGSGVGSGLSPLLGGGGGGGGFGGGGDSGSSTSQDVGGGGQGGFGGMGGGGVGPEWQRGPDGGWQHVPPPDVGPAGNYTPAPEGGNEFFLPETKGAGGQADYGMRGSTSAGDYNRGSGQGGASVGGVDRHGGAMGQSNFMADMPSDPARGGAARHPWGGAGAMGRTADGSYDASGGSGQVGGATVGGPGDASGKAGEPSLNTNGFPGKWGGAVADPGNMNRSLSNQGAQSGAERSANQAAFDRSGIGAGGGATSGLEYGRAYYAGSVGGQHPNPGGGFGDPSGYGDPAGTGVGGGVGAMGFGSQSMGGTYGMDMGMAGEMGATAGIGGY